MAYAEHPLSDVHGNNLGRRRRAQRLLAPPQDKTIALSRGEMELTLKSGPGTTTRLRAPCVARRTAK